MTRIATSFEVKSPRGSRIQVPRTSRGAHWDWDGNTDLPDTANIEYFGAGDPHNLVSIMAEHRGADNNFNSLIGANLGPEALRLEIKKQAIGHAAMQCDARRYPTIQPTLPMKDTPNRAKTAFERQGLSPMTPEEAARFDTAIGVAKRDREGKLIPRNGSINSPGTCLLRQPEIISDQREELTRRLLGEIPNGQPDVIEYITTAACSALDRFPPDQVSEAARAVYALLNNGATSRENGIHPTSVFFTAPEGEFSRAPQIRSRLAQYVYSPGMTTDA